MTEIQSFYAPKPGAPTWIIRRPWCNQFLIKMFTPSLTPQSITYACILLIMISSTPNLQTPLTPKTPNPLNVRALGVYLF